MPGTAAARLGVDDLFSRGFSADSRHCRIGRTRDGAVYGIVIKVVLFLIGFAVMRYIGRRRWRAMPTLERDALMATQAH